MAINDFCLNAGMGTRMPLGLEKLIGGYAINKAGKCIGMGLNGKGLLGLAHDMHGVDIHTPCLIKWTNTTKFKIHGVNNKGSALSVWLTDTNEIYFMGGAHSNLQKIQLNDGMKIRDLNKGWAYDHGIAIDFKGIPWEFGNTSSGQRSIPDCLGFNELTKYFNSPTHQVTQASCGWLFTVVLDTVGCVYFSGKMDYDDHPMYVPIHVNGFTNEVKICQIDAGRQFFGCVDTNGQVWIVGKKWIHRYLGKTWVEFSGDMLKPIILNELLMNDIIINSIECGSAFIFMIEKNKGYLYGCGQNDTYQLGLGHQQSVSGIHRLTKLKKHMIEQISCGSGHSIARTVNGVWYGWGDCGATHIDKLIGEFPDLIYIATPCKLAKLNAMGHHVIDVFCGFNRTTLIMR